MLVSISRTEPGAEALPGISLHMKSHNMSQCHLPTLTPFPYERKLTKRQRRSCSLILITQRVPTVTYRNFCRIFQELIRHKNKVTSLSMSPMHRRGEEVQLHSLLTSTCGKLHDPAILPVERNPETHKAR